MATKHNPGPGAISRNVQAVLRSFQSVVGALDDLDQNDSIENESTRFKMWAGNLGAHQSGPASLDYRLREAPHIHEQVLYLLRDLTQSLQDTLELAKPEGRVKALDEHVVDQSSEDDDFTDSEDDDISLETRLATLCADVKESIDCLLRLSVAIANPAPHERVRTVGLAGALEDVSFREVYDIGYVRDKFPAMSSELSTVLGKAITRRRQFFKYREAHHAKLASGLGTATQEDTSRTEVVPNTVASSLPDFMKAAKDVNLTTSVDVLNEDNRSDAAMSQTSYATSAGFLAEGLEGQAQHLKPPPPLRVPPLPAASERGFFECPFCYRMVSASTRAAWK